MQEKIEIPPKNPGLTNTAIGYSLLPLSIQTRNSGETVSVTNVLDDTEGLVPFDVFFDKTQTGSRNLDVGGGKFDAGSEHLKNTYGITNLVFDPYNRTKEHNELVEEEVKKTPVDSATSCSVLNVIPNAQDRSAHIRFIYDSLKANGHAFFTVWRGNGTGIPSELQSNRGAHSYLAEVASIFGKTNVYSPADDIGNNLVATKRG